MELISQLEANTKAVGETEITKYGPYGIEGFSQENLTFAKKVAETLSAQHLADYLILEQQFFIDQLHYKTKQEKIAAKNWTLDKDYSFT